MQDSNMLVKKYFLKEIKQLSSEIGRLGLAQDFINIKNEKNNRLRNLRARYLDFKLRFCHYKVWVRMSELYKIYKDLKQPELFLNLESDQANSQQEIHKELYKYDPNEIDPINLWVLCMFSNAEMREIDLFVDKAEYQQILREYGYSDLADYLDCFVINFRTYMYYGNK